MLTVNQATAAIKAQLDARNPVKVTMTNALPQQRTISNPGAVDQVAGVLLAGRRHGR